MTVTERNTNSLSPRQKRAIPFFTMAPSEKEACRLANISRKTFYEWMKNPTFKQEISRIRTESMEEALQSLKMHTLKAVETLCSLMDATSPSVQRGAANDILQHAVKFKEVYEIEARIKQLEVQSQQRRSR